VAHYITKYLGGEIIKIGKIGTSFFSFSLFTRYRYFHP
jgi:hypothetical protein